MASCSATCLMHCTMQYRMKCSRQYVDQYSSLYQPGPLKAVIPYSHTIWYGELYEIALSLCVA
eukprot:1709181-Rhodomonas_salina.3